MSAPSTFTEKVKRYIANYFQFDQRHTTFSAEVRGGFVTFLTMSYILLVNPQILTNWVGGDKGSVQPETKLSMLNNVASSTAAVCAIGTFLVGVLTNLPFAIGPGMGMNTFFAGAILVAHTDAEYPEARHTWDLAVTTTLFAGVIIFLASILNVTERIIALLPTVLKSAILVGIGLYQAFVGLRTMNVIESDPTELLKFVSHFDFDDSSATGTIAQILFAVTLFITAAMYVLEVNGAILIGIAFTTIIAWCFSLGGVSLPSSPIQVPLFSETFWNFDFYDFFRLVQWMGTCISFVLITLFDVAGIMFGVMTLVRQRIDQAARAAAVDPTRRQPVVISHGDAPLDDGEDHEDEAGLGLAAVEDESLLSHHPEIIAAWEARRAFTIVGFSTMVSAVLGCSPCIIFLECIAGVASGSRTGFSSVVTAAFFTLSLPFVPLFRNVPACASSPALVIIGCFMMSSASEIPWHDHKMAMPAFLTIAMMPFTASITPGIVIGILSYIVLHLVDYLSNKYRVWRGQTRPNLVAQEASPVDIEARSHRSVASSKASSHAHSLGYNVDEPHHGTVAFRPRGGATYPEMIAEADAASSRSERRRLGDEEGA